MNRKRKAYKGKKTMAALRNSLLVFLLGMLLGVLGKWSDYHAMFLAALTSGIQLWVLLGCAVAMESRSSWRAGLNVFLLLGGMVGAYYLTAEIMGAPWSKAVLTGWGIMAALSPIPGFFVWYGRGRSLQAWIICLGVLAFQVLAMLVLSGGVRLLDVALIVSTAAVLLWDKVVAKRHVS